uniref:Cytochrome P450 n=1 Tax=Megaselia scalaris TaxID=36166 RepID=T1GBN1_MEGSC
MENQECQDKLREEIMEISGTLDGKPISYEAIAKMKYADCVISEGMRKWPAAGLLDRICTKPTVLHDPISGKDVYLKKGDNVQ